jgi:hypothetical protein
VDYDRPRCARCGQVFRGTSGAEWHRVNRPNCAGSRTTVNCIHPDRPRHRDTPWCTPCYLTRVWKGDSPLKDGAWAAYRKAQAAARHPRDRRHDTARRRGEMEAFRADA